MKVLDVLKVEPRPSEDVYVWFASADYLRETGDPNVLVVAGPGFAVWLRVDAIDYGLLTAYRGTQKVIKAWIEAPDQHVIFELLALRQQS